MATLTCCSYPLEMQLQSINHTFQRSHLHQLCLYASGGFESRGRFEGHTIGRSDPTLQREIQPKATTALAKCKLCSWYCGDDLWQRGRKGEGAHLFPDLYLRSNILYILYALTYIDDRLGKFKEHAVYDGCFCGSAVRCFCLRLSRGFAG